MEVGGGQRLEKRKRGNRDCRIKGKRGEKKGSGGSREKGEKSLNGKN